MICATCGGRVIWMGSWSNLTHTECQDCGRTNNQIAEDRHAANDDDPSEDQAD